MFHRSSLCICFNFKNNKRKETIQSESFGVFIFESRPGIAWDCEHPKRRWNLFHRFEVGLFVGCNWGRCWFCWSRDALLQRAEHRVRNDFSRNDTSALPNRFKSQHHESRMKSYFLVLIIKHFIYLNYS